jgi:hypothetical protein
MKYRIWQSGNKYKIQRKRFLRWVWLDACKAWCNWYGVDHPHIFSSLEEVDNFLQQEKWHILKQRSIIEEAEMILKEVRNGSSQNQQPTK